MKKNDVNKGRLIGAHCYIEGGIENAPKRGAAVGCSVIQMFTKGTNQWKADPLSQSEVDAFRSEMEKGGIKVAIAHTGYLINLATVDPDVHGNSMESMRQEMKRAEALMLPYLVVHPGSHKEAGELTGILQIVENLRRLRDEAKDFKVQIVLETTAGQGSCIGYTFGHFSEIFSRLGWPADIGLCLDTAHIFQAGYNISTKKGYEDVMKELDEVVGLDYLRVIHVNDSKTECGSRVDRHEQLGAGKIGRDAFKNLVNDGRLLKIPMVIETPGRKSPEDDDRNLRFLRSFIK